MLLLSTLDRLVIGHSIRVELEHLPQVVVTISRDWVCQGSAQGSGEQSVVANVQKAKVRKSKAKSAKSKRKKQQRRNKTVVDLDVAAVAATTTTVGRYRWSLPLVLVGSYEATESAPTSRPTSTLPLPSPFHEDACDIPSSVGLGNMSILLIL